MKVSREGIIEIAKQLHHENCIKYGVFPVWDSLSDHYGKKIWIGKAKRGHQPIQNATKG